MPESKRRRRKGRKVTGKGRTSGFAEVIKQITPPVVTAAEAPRQDNQSVDAEPKKFPSMPLYDIVLSRFLYGNCPRCDIPLRHEFGEEEYSCENCEHDWTAEKIFSLKPLESHEAAVVEEPVETHRVKPSIFTKVKQILWR